MRVAALSDPSQIDVWRVEIDDSAWDAFASVLSSDERVRSGSFRHLPLQRRFARCRAALRVVLSSYVSSTAADMVFRLGERGKPELEGQPFHFNVTHSEGVALYAVSSGPVGIDVESVDDRREIDVEGLTDLVCHATERSVLASLPTAQRRVQFLRLWTQKESFCKAVGSGLRDDMRDVHFDASSSVSRVHDAQACGESSYFVHRLPCWGNYVASVCSTLEVVSLRCFDARPEGRPDAVAMTLEGAR